MNTHLAKFRVVKLGGSLLDLADLTPRLRRWLAAGSQWCNVIVVGGGRLADTIRDYDKRHGLDETVSQWLCLRAMSANAELVAALLPEADLVHSVAEFRQLPATTGLMVFDAWVFLRDEEPKLVAEPLPASWQVTSDSIAARLAEILGAAELVLLKSASPPANSTVASAVAAGYVDGYFPIAARRLTRIECVDLRGDEFDTALLARIDAPAGHAR
jgi:5-(aminomethyl)-3-furanmethanol phosphate kinase